MMISLILLKIISMVGLCRTFYFSQTVSIYKATIVARKILINLERACHVQLTIGKNADKVYAYSGRR